MYRTIVIVGNGQFPRKKANIRLILESDILICCDGGFSRLMGNSTARRRIESGKEFYITGDMDSLKNDLKEKYSSHIIPYHDQNINDQTKAFLLACRLTDKRKEIFSRIIFLGATGLREDHTVANLGLLMEYACSNAVMEKRCSVEMVSDYCRFLPATGDCCIECRTGDAISIFSTDPELTVVSDGLEWQTAGVRFTNWWQASLNRATKTRVTLKLSHPSRILISVSV